MIHSDHEVNRICSNPCKDQVHEAPIHPCDAMSPAKYTGASFRKEAEALPAED